MLSLHYGFLVVLRHFTFLTSAVWIMLFFYLFIEASSIVTYFHGKRSVLSWVTSPDFVSWCLRFMTAKDTKERLIKSITIRKMYGTSSQVALLIALSSLPIASAESGAEVRREAAKTASLIVQHVLSVFKDLVASGGWVKPMLVVGMYDRLRHWDDPEVLPVWNMFKSQQALAKDGGWWKPVLLTGFMTFCTFWIYKGGNLV